MGGDDDNDGNGKKSKNQFKQYKAELIPAMYYKPTLAQELRDKQIKKKMNKKKGHNLNSITGEHYEEEKKGEVQQNESSVPPDKEDRERSNSLQNKSTAKNTKNKMGVN